MSPESRLSTDYITLQSVRCTQNEEAWYIYISIFQRLSASLHSNYVTSWLPERFLFTVTRVNWTVHNFYFQVLLLLCFDHCIFQTVDYLAQAGTISEYHIHTVEQVLLTFETVMWYCQVSTVKAGSGPICTSVVNLAHVSTHTHEFI